MDCKSLIGCLIVLVGSAGFASAQEQQNPYPPGFILDRFDSFENTSVEFENAILDSFAIALLNKPDDIGYIIVYAGRKACNGEAQARAMRMKRYVVEHRAAEQALAPDGSIACSSNSSRSLLLCDDRSQPVNSSVRRLVGAKDR